MKARGATVPVFAGWEAMHTKRERRAEKRLFGAAGIDDTVRTPFRPSTVGPDVDGLRSGFL